MIFSKEIETHNRTSFWTMNLVLCGLLSLISLISRIYLGESPLRALALAVTAYCATLAILVLLRSIYRSSFSKSSLTLPEFVKICLLSLVAACLHASSIACVTRLLNHFTPMHWHFSQWTFHERFYLLVIILWPMYFGWSLGYFWVRAEFQIIEQERLGRREKAEAQKMELQLLRFQLDPHFLFNSLNGIVSEIHSDPDAASRVIEAAVQSFGRVDALYHVAGGSGRSKGDGPLHELTDDGWRYTVDLNLTSAVFSNRAAVRQFLKQGGGGSILNMGSVLGWSPSPQYFASHAYAATKAAIIGFSRATASYYAKDNIRVNVIAPALIQTPMSQRACGNDDIVKFAAAKQPLDGGRVGMPDDVDGAALFLLSRQAHYITGQVLAVDGGWCVSEGRSDG